MERLVFNKKEHKLEELEKYGFTYKMWNNQNYGMEYYEDYTSHITIGYFDIEANTQKGYVLLYDLIKDGLIIKEEV